MKEKFKKIFRSILSFYNKYFGVIDGIICLILFSSLDNKVVKFAFLALGIYSAIHWYKVYFKNLEYKQRIHSKVVGNSVLAIYGGVGTGKSTLARRLMNVFVSKDKQYFNFKCDGYKAFTWRHFLLLDKLESQCGVMIDECGRQYDSFKYSKDDNDIRSRIVTLNKFFRQFYDTGSICIYVDQSESNVNTALYRTVFYVIQCEGTRLVHTNILLWGLYELYKLFTGKKKKINPFALVSIEFADFTRTGEYATNYSINKDDMQPMHYVDSVQNMFGYHDTNVFKVYNPANECKPIIWGKNDKVDNQIMEQNFSLHDLQKSINTNGIDISQIKES